MGPSEYRLVVPPLGALRSRRGAEDESDPSSLRDVDVVPRNKPCALCLTQKLLRTAVKLKVLSKKYLVSIKIVCIPPHPSAFILHSAPPFRTDSPTVGDSGFPQTAGRAQRIGGHSRRAGGRFSGWCYCCTMWAPFLSLVPSPKVLERDLAKFDKSRPAVGMLNPVCPRWR